MGSSDDEAPYTAVATHAVGNAPWLRAGVSAPYAPDTAEAKEAVERLERQAKEQEDAAKELLKQRREAHAAELEGERVVELEVTAKRFFQIGCFALPWVHIIMWVFFWKEWKDPQASTTIKKCKQAPSSPPLTT